MKRDRATFRDVPFFVETAERSGGRRVVTHEYPGRDASFSEDMGRTARGFSLDGYVIGPNYLNERDALLAALESGDGPGDLAHPTYGRRKVAVLSFRVRETTREGGMARFSIDFDETPERPAQPTAVRDEPTYVVTSAARARQSAGAGFRSRYTLGARMTGVAEALRRVTLAADIAHQGVVQNVLEAAKLRRDLDRTVASVATLAGSPDTLIATVTELVGGFVPSAASETAMRFRAPSVLRAVLGLYSFDPGPRPPALTPSRVKERANFDAFKALAQTMVVIRAAELALSETFDTLEEATATVAQIAGLLDEQAEGAGDNVFQELAQLSADLVRAVPAADVSLPRLQTYTPAVTLPSLVLAHRLYGSVGGEADILARNRIRNPLFVPGGRSLQVLGT